MAGNAPIASPIGLTQPNAQPGRAIVEFVGVCKSFGPVVVLNNIQLAFREGETTVVLGHSGSGKSVILKHIVGLLRPDRGEVRFRGRRIDTLGESDLAPIRREIGFLFQLSALFDSMTIAENLEFPLTEHTDLGPAERRRRVEEALSLVDLKGVEDRFPSELSGGQQRRVALARASILRPSLMLYDEPTTGLDPIRAAGISDLINKLRQETGMTAIVVTHDLLCMRKVADRVVMLYDGRIHADGTPEELEASTDEHVQHFIAGIAEAEMDRVNAQAATAPPARQRRRRA